MPSSTDRKFHISLIKAVSALAVVVLHTFFAAFGSFEAQTGSWYAVRIIRNLMLWSVPCFVMATGELLLSKERVITLKKLFSRYILRAVVVLVVFTGINTLFDRFVMGAQNKGFMFFLKALATDGSWSHMWYLYLLLAIYLTLPAFKLAADHASSGELNYLLIVLAVFLSVIPTLNTVFPAFNPAFYIPVTTIYPLYLLLGHALSVGSFKVPTPLSWCLLVVSLAASGYLTYLGAAQGRSLSADSYSSVIVVITALSFYTLLSGIRGCCNKYVLWLVEKISGCTMGIYLIHMIVLKFTFVKLGFKPANPGILLAAALGIFAASFLLTYLLRLIPGVKKFL